MSTNTLSDYWALQSQLESHECVIRFLSKCFGIPMKTIKNVIINEFYSVFHGKYTNERVTSNTKTVWPTVVTNNDVDARPERSVKVANKTFKKNTIKPIRRKNPDCEKNILQDAMEELSKTMPSWNLSIDRNTSYTKCPSICTERLL